MRRILIFLLVAALLVMAFVVTTNNKQGSSVSRPTTALRGYDTLVSLDDLQDLPDIEVTMGPTLAVVSFAPSATPLPTTTANVGSDQFYVIENGMLVWTHTKASWINLGPAYNTEKEAQYHWAEKTVYVERFDGESDAAFERRIVEIAVNLVKEHCALVPQYAAGLATHIAKEQLRAYREANRDKIANFLQAFGLSKLDFLDYKDLIHIVGLDLDIGDNIVTGDIIGIALAALDRVDLDRSEIMLLTGPLDWWCAENGPNFPDKQSYLNLAGKVSGTNDKWALHIVSKDDGAEKFECNIWMFTHSPDEDGVFLTTFFDLLHRGRSSNPPPVVTPPIVTTPPTTTTSPPVVTEKPTPKPTPTPRPTKDPSQDPVNNGNADDGGQNEDPGPSVHQTAQPTRPPETYVPPPVVTAPPATQAPAPVVTQAPAPVVTQAPAPVVTQAPAQVIQETAPPAPPISVVTDSHDTDDGDAAGNENGAFTPPD